MHLASWRGCFSGQASPRDRARRQGHALASISRTIPIGALRHLMTRDEARRIAAGEGDVAYQGRFAYAASSSAGSSSTQGVASVLVN
jgi:hypothetical protein